MEDFTCEKKKGIGIVTVPFEELDASNAMAFREGVAPYLDKYRQIILDVSRLDFVDSSGLGAFLSALKTVKANSGEMKIAGVSRNVRNVFELVHLYKLVEYFDTREEAVGRFTQ